jgi:hypothetical protein
MAFRPQADVAPLLADARGLMSATANVAGDKVAKPHLAAALSVVLLDWRHLTLVPLKIAVASRATAVPTPIHDLCNTSNNISPVATSSATS